MSCLGRSLFILQDYHSFCLSPAVPFHYRIFVNYRKKNPVLPLLVRCSAEGLMKSIFHVYSTETLQMEWAKCFLLKLKPVQMFLWRFSFFFFQLSKLTFYLFQYQFFKFPHEQFICGVSSTYLSGFCSSVNHLDCERIGPTQGTEQTLWCNLSPRTTHRPDCELGPWVDEVERQTERWVVRRGPGCIQFVFSQGSVSVEGPCSSLSSGFWVRMGWGLQTGF